jgi:hypothetical protein
MGRVQTLDPSDEPERMFGGVTEYDEVEHFI